MLMKDDRVGGPPFIKGPRVAKEVGQPEWWRRDCIAGLFWLSKTPLPYRHLGISKFSTKDSRLLVTPMLEVYLSTRVSRDISFLGNAVTRNEAAWR